MIVLINFITVIIKSVGEKSSNVEYVPFIAYYLIKSEPMMMKSTLRFIKLFRNKERLKGSEGEYLELMTSAVDYIDRVNFEDLKMTSEDFETKYSLYEKLCSARFEEQLGIWRYGPVLIESEKDRKAEEHRKTLKEIQKILKNAKKHSTKGFNDITIGEVKSMIEIQSQIIEKLKNVS